VTLLDAVRALGAQADALAQETEGLRRLPDDLAAALVDTGLPRAWVPKAYGGPEHDLLTVLDAIEELAFHDGATAWCGMIAVTTSAAAAYLPADWAERIYGDPRAVTGGFAMPAATGQRDATREGITVTGRWQWGSFTHHCTWIGGGAMVDGVPLFVYFERGQVELLDTWRVSGLKGTGSTDYQVREAFVPEGRWLVLGGPPVVNSTVYRFPFFGRLALAIAAVGLGLARRAEHELIEVAGAKRPMGSSRTLADRPVIQAEMAKAEAARRAAHALLRQTVDDATAAAAATDTATVPDEHRRLVRLAATHAAWRSAEAVDRCYHAAGGSAVYDDSPLQRVFRDVHVLTQHAMIAERTYEPIGRMALGLPTDVSQL
jgi:alkylation response protein AidB-like acyl-CoA dehydrogenase